MLDGREVAVTLSDGNDGDVKLTINNRCVLALPSGAADDLHVALKAPQFGKSKVAATDDGTPVKLDVFNDQINIIKGTRAVVKIAFDDGPALAALMRPKAEGADPAQSLAKEQQSECVNTPPTTGEVSAAAPGAVSVDPFAGAKEGRAGAAVSPEPVKQPPAHRSNSQVSTWGECGHKYWITRLTVEGASQRPSVPALAGTALHKVAEWFERHAWLAFKQPFKTLVKPWPTESEAAARFTRYFTDQIAETRAVEQGGRYADPASWYVGAKGKEPISWWYANGPEYARRYARDNCSARQFHTLALDGKLFVEHRLSYKIAEIPYEGIVDHATLDSHGYVDVVDNKSGAKPSDRGFQVVTYAKVIQAQYPHLKVRGGMYLDMRTGEETYYGIDSWSWPEIEHIYSTADRGITAGIFLPVVGRHCDWCSVKRKCDYGGKRQ